jgi:hypothetical protein
VKRPSRPHEVTRPARGAWVRARIRVGVRVRVRVRVKVRANHEGTRSARGAWERSVGRALVGPRWSATTPLGAEAKRGEGR